MKTLMAPHAPLVVSPSGNGIIKSDRRASKPLMEKRRRERINKSLNELKSILLDALRKDSTCHSKLEKADILEMTVRYLRSIQRQRMTAAMTFDPSIINKYRAGYAECKAEVSKFLDNSDSMRTDVRSRLMSHLGNNTYVTQSSLVASNQHSQLLGAVPSLSVSAGMGQVPIAVTPANQINAIAAVAAAMHGNPRNRGQQPTFPTSPPTSPDEQYSQTGSLSPGECSPECNRSPSLLSPTSLRRNFHSFSQDGHRVEPQVHDGFGRLPNSPRFADYTQVEERISSSPSDYASPEFRYSPEQHAEKYFIHGAANQRSVYQRHGDFCEPFVEFPIKIEPKSPLSDREGGDHVWRPW